MHDSGVIAKPHHIAIVLLFPFSDVIAQPHFHLGGTHYHLAGVGKMIRSNSSLLAFGRSAEP